MAIRVRFPLAYHTFRVIIKDAQGKDENPFIVDESSNYIDIEYPSLEHFNRAKARFEGMLEYKELQS